MNRNHKLLIAFLAILFIITGFFREFVFLNVNEQMRVTYYNSPDPHVAPILQWLGSFSYTTLYYLKWLLTLAFTMVFALLAALIVHILFRDKKLVRLSLIAYSAVFFASFLFFLSGVIFNNGETTYAIARFLAGIIESPAMLIILLGAFTIIRRN